MPDPVSALARKVLKDNLGVSSGSSVVVEAWDHSLPFVPPFVREARRMGAQPTVLYESEAAYWGAVADRTFGPFGRLSRAERAAVAAADAYLYFWGPAEMARAFALGAVGQRLTAYNDEWYATARKGGLRGCRMTLGLASDATARRFGLSGPRWRRALVRAGMADARRMQAHGARLARRLRSGVKLRLHHPNGTDLTARLAQVHVRVDSGVVAPPAQRGPMGMMTNNPTGQVIAAFEAEEADGTVVGNRTVWNFVNFARTSGVRWKVGSGRVRRYAIESGRAEFEKSFAAAPKGRDRLSFLSIGLNPYARAVPPCEDTEEGAVLLGMGGNAGFGGRIQMPFSGHAMVAGATLELDGAPVVRAGRLP